MLNILLKIPKWIGPWCVAIHLLSDLFFIFFSRISCITNPIMLPRYFSLYTKKKKKGRRKKHKGSAFFSTASSYSWRSILLLHHHLLLLLFFNFFYFISLGPTLYTIHDRYICYIRIQSGFTWQDASRDPLLKLTNGFWEIHLRLCNIDGPRRKNRSRSIMLFFSLYFFKYNKKKTLIFPITFR